MARCQHRQCGEPVWELLELQAGLPLTTCRPPSLASLVQPQPWHADGLVLLCALRRIIIILIGAEICLSVYDLVSKAVS